MATVPLVTNTLRCRMLFNLGGSELGGSRFFMSYTGGPAVAADLASFAHDISNQFGGHLASLMTTGYALDQVVVDDIGQSPIVRGEYSASVPGTRSGDTDSRVLDRRSQVLDHPAVSWWQVALRTPVWHRDRSRDPADLERHTHERHGVAVERLHRGSADRVVHELHPASSSRRVLLPRRLDHFTTVARSRLQVPAEVQDQPNHAGSDHDSCGRHEDRQSAASVESVDAG